MTESVPSTERERDLAYFTRWCKGDTDAAMLCMQLLYIAHLWDDLVDGDQERPPDHVNDAFWMALVEVQTNSFYERHRASIHPVIVQAINDWRIANRLEATRDDHATTISYTLRVSILSVLTHIVFLVGGYEWVERVGPELRLYGQRETLVDYQEGLKCQTQEQRS